MNKTPLIYGPLLYDEICILKDYVNTESLTSFYVFENNDTIRFLKPPTERPIHKPFDNYIPFDSSLLILTLIFSGLFIYASKLDGSTSLVIAIIISCGILSFVLLQERRMRQLEIIRLKYTLHIANTEVAYQLLQRIYLRAIILGRRDILYS